MVLLLLDRSLITYVIPTPGFYDITLIFYSTSGSFVTVSSYLKSIDVFGDYLDYMSLGRPENMPVLKKSS